MPELTRISKEPQIHPHAKDVACQINTKYYFPKDLGKLERSLRISLGLPFKGRWQGQLPYGYLYNEATNTCEPIPECFHLLWQARRYLYSCSLREVSQWLKYKTDKLNLPYTISFKGLSDIMIRRPPYEECLLPLEEREQIVKSLTAWNKTQTE